MKEKNKIVFSCSKPLKYLLFFFIFISCAVYSMEIYFQPMKTQNTVKSANNPQNNF